MYRDLKSLLSLFCFPSYHSLGTIGSLYRVRPLADLIPGITCIFRIDSLVVD
jgi:hypothetical protein